MTKVHHSTVLTDTEGTFFAAVDAAEVTRQSAITPVSSAAAVKVANVAYHLAVVSAANTANAPHLGVASRHALQDLIGQPY